MTVEALLTQERSLCRINASSRKRVLQEIATALANAQHPADALFEGLMARERLGSTGLGEGVAIPHCRAPVASIAVCLATTMTAIDYEAGDGAKVDIFVALVVPKDEHEAHLSALAEITTVLVDAENRTQLRACESNHALLSCMQSLLRS